MSDLIQGLKAETGLEDSQVEGGLGAVFDFLKGQLPPELFSSIQQAIPQVDQLTQALKAGERGEGSGGLLGTVVDLAGKVFGGGKGGGGDLTDLIGSLAKAGFTLDQAREFVPKAIAFIRKILPDDLFEKISLALPGLAGAILGGSASEGEAPPKAEPTEF